MKKLQDFITERGAAPNFNNISHDKMNLVFELIKLLENNINKKEPQAKEGAEQFLEDWFNTYSSQEIKEVERRLQLKPSGNPKQLIEYILKKIFEE